MGLSFKFLLSLLVGLLAVYYRHHYGMRIEEAEIPEILASLQKAEKKVELNTVPKVAVGFGGCMDIFVDAVDFFKEMGMTPTGADIRHHDSIRSGDDLVEGFLYYFTHGAAGERYVNNEKLFHQMVAAAIRIPSHRTVVGGNAPVIANRLALEGAQILLAATGADDFTSKLHTNIELTGAGAVETSDVHLILEYKSGEKWGKHVSPRANRYIAIADKHNPTISSLEAFTARHEQFDADLYVVGGLQVMDNFQFKEEGERRRRLSALGELMSSVRSEKKKPIHFEMASLVEEELMREVVDKVLPHADSLGMNEQELPNLVTFLREGRVTTATDAYPRTARVLDQMRELYGETARIGGATSRIHVHTLAFQAIMTRVGSPWRHTMSAAAHASLTANRHICGRQEVDVRTSKMLMDESFSTTAVDANHQRVRFSAAKPVSCWNETIGGDAVLVCVAPNLVCTKVFQTAGGGDNISAAGLRFQI